MKRTIGLVVLCASIVLADQAVSQRTLLNHQLPKSSGRSARVPGSPVGALPIVDFKMTAPSTGWVSTGNRLLWSSDNGTSWKDISPSTPDLTTPSDRKFSGVWFNDSNVGWVLYETEANDQPPPSDPSWRPQLYHTYLASTADGGATWRTVSEIPSPVPWQEVMGGGTVSFADSMHGWVDLSVLDGGVLYETSDAGRTWRRCPADRGAGLTILAVTAQDAFFAGGRDNSLYATHDGGSTIQEVSLPNPPGIANGYFPIYSLPVFKSPLNGYEVVNYRGPIGSSSAAVLFESNDAGITWIPSRRFLNLPEGVEVDTGVADSTWILPFKSLANGITVRKLESGGEDSAPDYRGSRDFQSCRPSFATPSQGWINCAGVLSSTTDGGSTWTTITPRTQRGVLTTAPTGVKQDTPCKPARSSGTSD